MRLHPNRLIRARWNKGWTQGDLAAAAGMKQQAISRLEKGLVIPRVNTVARLALALGVEIDTLLVDETEKDGDVDASPPTAATG